MTASQHRLPQDLSPTLYEFQLTPDLEAGTFEGSGQIHLEVNKPTSQIVLHSAGLELGGLQLMVEDSQALCVILDATAGPGEEQVTISLPLELKIGQKVRLSLSWKGTLSDSLRALYKVKYTMPDGRKRIGAATKFEPAHARHMLPCFDEPSFKAVFKVTLVVPEEMTALSNGKVVKLSKGAPGHKRVEFAPTPKMSTYLLAAVVGDYEYVERMTPYGVTLRVYATPGKAKHGAFALDIAERALAYFEEYFGIPYPLEKMDLVALPQFGSGAMENWGLITFREALLLADPEVTPLARRQYVAEVVAHEIAHMWFGNLATMDWWGALWLNESFATLLAKQMLDAAFPEWKLDEKFAIEAVGAALKLDGLSSTHPIEVDVESVAQVEEIFDRISYEKGGSVLRMFRNRLGNEAFRDGVRCYLKQFAYSNARSLDFWNALAEASGKPEIAEAMTYWTRTAGYPLLTADIGSRGDDITLEIRQEPFSYLADGGPSKDETLWPVPVRFDGAHLQIGYWLPCRQSGWQMPSIMYGNEEKEMPVTINTGRVGFYRTRYTEVGYARLQQRMCEGSLSSVDAATVLDDAYALGRAGKLPATTFLELAEAAAAAEPSYPVWEAIWRGLTEMNMLLRSSGAAAKFQTYAREVFVQPLFDAVGGWEAQPDESSDCVLLRTVALDLCLRFFTEECVTGQEMFWRQVSGEKAVRPDLRQVVYSMAIRRSSESYRETPALLGMYRRESSQEEKTRILMALCKYGNVRQMSDFIMSDEVSAQDLSACVEVLGNMDDEGMGRFVFDFIQRQWPEFQRRFVGDPRMFNRIIGSFERFNDELDADRVVRFFAENLVPGTVRRVQQCIETIRVNARWVKKNGVPLQEFLDSWLK